MNYFSAISKRAEELNQQGQEYLDRLPFLANDEVCQRLMDIACEIDESAEENPDWVEMAMDGALPFSGIPRNGSIYFSLGYAVVARDARLRNLLEVAEGRETQELNLATLAEKEIVEQYAACE